MKDCSGRSHMQKSYPFEAPKSHLLTPQIALFLAWMAGPPGWQASRMAGLPDGTLPDGRPPRWQGLPDGRASRMAGLPDGRASRMAGLSLSLSVSLSLSLSLSLAIYFSLP